MAYGVKYRLEFSDVLGYGKKVEILKKDYTGEVLPMVGTEEPVVIKWNSKNDFYSPIIGSRCQLNLIVTDTVQYDDFYKFDEREYKVKVSFSKSKSQTYADRITEDAGFYESLECIDNFLGDFYTLSTFYEKRVQDDNGFVESLDCVSNAIIDEKYPIWDTYWVGWLVVDRFKEQMTSTPYKVSFNAFDGLGSLSDYDAPISANDDVDESAAIYDYERIKLILDNLNLNLDVYYINDLTQKTKFYTKFPGQKTIPNYKFELTDNLDLFTAKEQLEFLLKTYNMRIYQSLGKWFIVENSNVFDIRVKDEIIALNVAGTPPDNIRELINLKLKGGDTEFLKAEKYNYLGVSQGNENVSTLRVAPKDLIPISNNLSREYLQPIESVTREFTTTQLDRTYFNSNAGFEYGLSGWNVTLNRAILSTDVNTKQGAKSIYLDAETNSIGFSCINTTRNDGVQNLVLNDAKFGFSFFVDADDKVNYNINYSIISTRIGSGTEPQFLFWNIETKEWQTAQHINSISSNEVNSWVDYSQNLKSPSSNGLDIDTNTREIKFYIYNTTTTSSDYNTTYFDNIGIYQERSEFYLTNPETLNVSKDLKIRTQRASGSTGYSTVKKFESIYYPYKKPANDDRWLRTRDRNFISGTTDKLGFLTNLVSQNIMNDYRNYVTRYTGSFRSLNPTPLSMHNRIWFDWKDVLQDEQSTIIDEISFGIKSNKYNVKTHLPNDDTDLDVNIRIIG